MSLKFIKKIPTAEEVISNISLSEHLKNIKAKKDKEIKNVFENKSDKFLVIVGPCSADNEDAVCEYVSKLAKLQENVKEKVIIIPRIYTNKPRTTGEGYKGMMHQPDPQKKPDLVEGIKAIRKLHIRALKESHLVAADEMLYPSNYTYLSDILGYVAIGARSVENQQHRITVSGIDVPAGMKNPTSGDISVMLNSIRAAQISHTFIYSGHEVITTGNPLAHAILRGSVNQYGRNFSNYHYENLIDLACKYEDRNLFNPAVIIDTNHANSAKQFDQQPRIAHEVLMSRKLDSKIKQMVKGLMIESYLIEGNQNIDSNVYGKSITDPCLGWDDTEKLIYNIAENA